MAAAPTLADATEADLPALVAIYNEVIATSTAVYSSEPVTHAERRDWWRARTGQGYPVLIARDARGVCGFRSRPFLSTPVSRSALPQPISTIMCRC